MARPMVLMQSNDLQQLYGEWKLGVPVKKLKDKYSIELTEPTIKKLLNYYDIGFTANQEIQKQVFDSLFPDWLVKAMNKTHTMYRGYYQPSEYFYTGRMPLGEWKKR